MTLADKTILIPISPVRKLRQAQVPKVTHLIVAGQAYKSGSLTADSLPFLYKN